jgi:hypothetical protein
MTSLQIEVAIADYFNPRHNIIVPNVWWGLGFKHELDLMVLTKSGYAYEIEIKTSKSDIKADLRKCHAHASPRISRLYFAVPDELKNDENIPLDAGILSVIEYENGGRPSVKKIREATRRKSIPLTESERLKLAELGTMRIWTLKQNILGRHLGGRNETL